MESRQKSLMSARAISGYSGYVPASTFIAYWSEASQRRRAKCHKITAVHRIARLIYGRPNVVNDALFRQSTCLSASQRLTPCNAEGNGTFGGEGKEVSGISSQVSGIRYRLTGDGYQGSGSRELAVAQEILSLYSLPRFASLIRGLRLGKGERIDGWLSDANDNRVLSVR